MEKIILGLCTSGSRLKVSVLAGGRFFQAQKKVFNQERVLFPLVKRELKKAGAELRGVTAVCAARGPGRFTGIRISLTLAGALKAMAGARVYTATLFEILALQAAESAHFRTWAGKTGGTRIAALLHAFKDEYFCQFFTAGKLPRPEGEPVWLKEDEMRRLLSGKGSPFYAIADAEEAPGIYGLLPSTAVKAPPALSRMIPAYSIKAALAYKNGTLKPLYLKPAKYELESKKPVLPIC
ncbi:MAG: tRNA (adenosine(37)-N6)-threonylcarbamoyltransferase complex dimerization subunit type 1 TsaB [Elusimicrobia bacterium]|nr:tRNA (adenosine(37)-N6)-threonylcarbamoyltransferase complex dimerization subunit type 1 TsaB [Elusimicrobiota bacterium]